MAEHPEGQSGKGRRRQAAKAGIRSASSKVKATVHLSVSADQRLNIHCAMMGMDRSAMIEDLITKHLRRYVVSDRGETETAGESVEAA
jgi:hypothetical protein